jgi:hypothetical protein
VGIVAAEINRPCTVFRVADTGTPDDYGDMVVAPDSGTDTVCELQRPGGSALRAGREPEDGALDLSLWQVFLPPGTDITGQDYIVVDGERYDMAGDPAPVRDPWTRQVDHIEGIVRRRA